MKLKTKIIPLTVLATSSAIIAPISLSSCGAGNVVGRGFDLTRVYKPTVERYKKDTLTKYEINELYAEQLANRPETFVEDYMWSKSWSGSAFDQLFFWQQLFPDPELTNLINDQPIDRYLWGSSTYNYKRDVESISNLSINFTEYSHGSTVWTIPLLSFTLTFSSSVNDIYFIVPEEDCSVSLSGTVAGNIKFLNVPFWITTHYVEDEIGRQKYVISFEPNSLWMFGDGAAGCPDWRLQFDIASSLSGQIEYSTGLIERVADDWNFIRSMANGSLQWSFRSLTYDKCFNNVFTTSFYLERVSCSDI